MSSKYVSQLFSSHPSTDQPFSSPQRSSQLISAVLHARKFLLSERSLLHKTALGGVACHVEEMPVELPAKLVSEDKPYMDPQNGLSYEK